MSAECRARPYSPMVEYSLGRSWPRRSAYDSFDEDSWMEGVRERLRSALYTPADPSKTYVQLETARESEHIDEENEIQEDASAKNHVRLTSEAMQELFTLGGVIDQESGSPVRIDDFAERVWRVDQPRDSNSASSLFQAFNDGSGTDIDAMLRHRLCTQPQREESGLQDGTQSCLIQEISMQSPEQSEMRDSNTTTSETSSNEETQESDTLQRSTSDASISSQNISMDEERHSDVQSDELTEGDEMEQELDADASDMGNVLAPEIESASGQEDFNVRMDRIGKSLVEEAEELQSDSKDAPAPQLNYNNLGHEGDSLTFDMIEREYGTSNSGLHQLNSSSAIHPGSQVANHGRKTDPILVDSESDGESVESSVSDTTHDSHDRPAESTEEAGKDNKVEGNHGFEVSQDTGIPYSGSEQERIEYSNSPESSTQLIGVENDGKRSSQHETAPMGEHHSTDHRIPADAVEVEINEKRKAALASLSGRAASKKQESSSNVDSSLHNTYHPEDESAPRMLSTNQSNSLNYSDADGSKQYTPNFSEVTDMPDRNASEDRGLYTESTNQSDNSQSSHFENTGNDANELYHSTKTNGSGGRTSAENPDSAKTDMRYYLHNLDSHNGSQEEQQSSREDVTQGPLPDFPEGAWNAFVSESYSSYAPATSSQDANIRNVNHSAAIAPLVHTSETGDELRDESQNGYTAKSQGLLEPLTFDTDIRGLDADTMHFQDPQATVKLIPGHDTREEDVHREKEPTTANNSAHNPAHIAYTDENEAHRSKDQAEVKQRHDSEDQNSEEVSLANSSSLIQDGTLSSTRVYSSSVHPEQKAIPFETKDQEKQSDCMEGPSSQASQSSSSSPSTLTQALQPSFGSLPTEEQEIRTESHRNHYPITRSHCHSQRLILLKETGSPTFIVPSCVLDPNVLAKEGAEKEDVNINQLNLVTLNADALPESVYHTLCRIVSPSLLDEVSVTSDSQAARWMIEDVGMAQSDTSSEKDDEPSSLTHSDEPSSTKSNSDVSYTAHRAPSRGNRRPRKSDSSSGIANYIPPDQPDRSRPNSPADVSIEELEQLPTSQPKRARTSSPTPRMRLRRADERRPTQRYSPGP